MASRYKAAIRGEEGAYDSTVKGPSELKLAITISTSKTVLDLKEEISSKSDVEKDRQRLIYSGTFWHPVVVSSTCPARLTCRKGVEG